MPSVFTIPEQAYAILKTMERNPRAAVIQAQLFDQDGAEPFWKAFLLGSTLLAWERISESVEWLEAAHELAQQAELPQLWQLHTLRALLLQRSLADSSTEIEAWTRLIEQYQKLNEMTEAARTAIYLARAWHSKRDPQAVQQIVDRWLPYLDNPHDRSDAAKLQRVLGAALVAKGEYLRTISLLQAAIAWFAHDANPLEIAKCQVEQAWALIASEQLDEAQTLLDQAAVEFQAHDLPLQQAFVKLNQSALLQLRGDYAGALARCQQARELFNHVGRTIDVGSCEGTLGAIYQQIGHWDAAQAHYMLALAIFTEKSAQGRMLMLYLNLASIAILKRDPSLAHYYIQFYEKAPLAAEHQLFKGSASRIKADIFYQEAAIDLAMETLYLAHDQFLQNGEYTRAAECRLEHTWIGLQHHNGQALDQRLLEELVDQFASQPIHQWRALYGLARLAELQHQPTQALSYYEAASQCIFTLRRQLASEHLSSSLFTRAKQLYLDAFACALGLNNVTSMLLLAEQQRALTIQRLLLHQLPTIAQGFEQTQLLQSIREISRLVQTQRHNAALKAQLQAQLADYVRMLGQLRHQQLPPQLPDQQLEIRTIQANLQRSYGSHWTILSYCWIEHNLLIIGIDQQSIFYEYIAITKEVEQLLRLACDPQSRNFAYRDGRLAPDRDELLWSLQTMLGSLLIPKRVQQQLHADYRLYLVPSGVLHQLPWPALRIADKWLCEVAILQVVPSLTLFTSSPTVASSKRIFLGGCSTFNHPYPNLPHVAAELHTIATDYPADYTLDLQPQCQLASIKAMTKESDYAIIHLATHASMRPIHGLIGHIAFADGELWLSEIIHLNVAHALVLLSTCDGAVAELLPGEENLSLAWAWIVAGARGVLANLWPSRDGSLSTLLNTIHTTLRKGDDPALALALAHRQAIQREDLVLDWGGLVFTSQYYAAERD
ncbi:MAG: CHAT domain-containing protein [Chloroflexi bacterium]|nr:CHAT domain-containing protein [Chloroflexota bacterium]